ncbi:Light-sensor Protein kinase [Puccinia graminis f. sp. tritici]|nr:Light-sensor Protein kinase [Puccinia graminis f. sp. tritici]
MLYDRDQPTARLMCKSQEELSKPLNMTHCHLRAMSPIHIKYLANMGVRSSFSISIIMNDELWGLISCHSYGRFGQRVTFPTRHFCTMLGDTVSRNILRLNLSQRLQSRKLINTTSTSKNPSGYIVAKAEDLLWLFDAQAGVLSIGEEAKILGVVSNSQEILAILEYLRVRKFDTIQVSTDINQTFPDIEYPGGFESISGLLVIPLSRSGQDFICFFRPAQSKEIHWAGNPHEKLFKDDKNSNILEPRKSFKIWSETVKERSKAWTDEQLETGSVLSLVYGKFIDVWRQKEAAVQNNQLQALLLSNASHEVRTPLHQILSTLELALDGQLDEDTRDNLSKSYSASRALVHVINDLLDLTKAEQGGDLFSRDPFNLPSTLQEAVSIHHREAERKGLAFEMVEDPRGAPVILQGDRARLRQVVSNLVGNAVKHTTEGLIHVQWGFEPQETVQPDPQDQNLMSEDIVRISVAVTDTGKGIPEAQLENIFRAFEQVGSGESQDDRMCESIGLGLAVVGRVVHNMGGQLRVDSTVNQGSKFTITLPFVVPKNNNSRGSTARNSDDSSNVRSHGSDSFRSKHSGKMQSSRGSQGSNHGSIGTSSSGIDEIVDAITGESSGRNSSEAPYSPRLASSFQNRKSPRKSISFGSTEGSKGSGSAHSLGSNMGGEMSRRRISSASNQSLSSKSHNIAESHRRLPKGTPASPRMATNDGPSKTKQVTPQEDISRRHSTKPRTTEPSQPLSPSSNKPKKDRNAFASKIERPSIHTITEPGEPSSSTLTPERAKRLQADDNKPLSPNPVQHISDYQKPNRNQTPAKQPMKVMVVEDDPINRLILKKKLTLSGHSVSLTVHGQEAIELFERDPSKFDIILMDLQMPICDGMQATRKIREFEKNSLKPPTAEPVEKTEESDPTDFLPKTHQVNFGVPIIAVSASLHEAQRKDIIEAGMDGWILKPVDFNRLATLMIASVDLATRAEMVYKPGTWDQGGWLGLPKKSARNPARK